MPKKVLIVEDDQVMINNLANKLRAEGFTVVTAMDGEVGWTKVREEKPDLLVLDIMLPGLEIGRAHV